MENPTDCASRGVDPSTLKDHDVWFSGPSWLKLNETKWPIEDCSFNRITGEERQQTKALVAIIENDLIQIIEDHSSLIKNFRLLAWCGRFIQQHQQHQTKKTNESNFRTSKRQRSRRRTETLHEISSTKGIR